MSVEVKAIRHESARPVLTRPGYAAPSVIVASAELADVGLSLNFAVFVSPGGTFRVRRLTVSAAGSSAAITSRALRTIRLDYLAHEAVRQHEQPVSMLPDHDSGAFQAFQFAADATDPWGSHGNFRDIRNPQDQIWRSSPALGRRLTSREQAEQAARIYTEAVATGSRAPTQAVAAELGYSRSQASRMIRTARDLGLLPNPHQSPQPNEGMESSANDQDD